MTPTVQRVSFVIGWVLLALGIAGFITSPGAMAVDATHAARIFGIFPTNIVENVLHVTWGVWGLAASQWQYSSRRFARISGVCYIAVAIVGLFSMSIGQFLPVGSNDIWLDAVIGVVLAWAGFSDHGEMVAA